MSCLLETLTNQLLDGRGVVTFNIWLQAGLMGLPSLGATRDSGICTCAATVGLPINPWRERLLCWLDCERAPFSWLYAFGRICRAFAAFLWTAKSFDDLVCVMYLSSQGPVQLLIWIQGAYGQSSKPWALKCYVGACSLSRSSHIWRDNSLQYSAS